MRARDAAAVAKRAAVHRVEHRIVRPRARAVFHPSLPIPRSTIYKITGRLGISIARGARPDGDLSVWWTPEQHPLDPRWASALNAGAADVTKSRVSRVADRIFPISIGVDPTGHQGPCLAKSERNGQSRARIVECPLAGIEPGWAYQRLLDPPGEGGLVWDYRVPYFTGDIPFVYRKWRTVEDRFGESVRSEMLETGDALDADEIATVRRFAVAMGLDFGEMDLLRDSATGGLFVVDVNPTAWGPPRELPEITSQVAVDRLAEAFEAAFL